MYCCRMPLLLSGITVSLYLASNLSRAPQIFRILTVRRHFLPSHFPTGKNSSLKKQYFIPLKEHTATSRAVEHLQKTSISRLQALFSAAFTKERVDLVDFISKWLTWDQRTEILRAATTPKKNPIELAALCGIPNLIGSSPSSLLPTYGRSSLAEAERLIEEKYALIAQVEQNLSLKNADQTQLPHPALSDLSAGSVKSRAFGREEILQQLCSHLAAEDQGNPVLLGESGVGKTAIIEELAHRCKEGRVPEALKGKKVWALSLEGLQAAGAKYWGELERHLDNILKAVEKEGNVILFIDEMHRMTMLGATGADNTSTLGQHLKGILARRKILFIGASTREEFDRHVTQVDPAFARRWQQVLIPEFPAEAVVPVLRKIFAKYNEDSTQLVVIPEEALHIAAELARRYLPYAKSPAKEKELIIDAITALQEEQNISAAVERQRAALSECKEALQAFSGNLSLAMQREKEKLQKKTSDIQQLLLATEAKAKQQEATKKKSDILRHAYSSYKKQLEAALKSWEEDKGSCPRDVLLLHHLWTAQKKEQISQQHATIDPAFPTTVTSQLLAAAVSKKSGIPLSHLSLTNEQRSLEQIERQLNEKVIGQPLAVSSVARACLLFHSGMKMPNRTIGNFLFFGPTGVGKTFLAQELAKELVGTSTAFFQHNMAEYRDPFAIKKLIGGFGNDYDSGLLVKQLRRFPHCVVLLDEFEKAHPSLYQVLLQLFDQGKITNNNGELIDGTNAIFILTTNIGAEQLLSNSKPFKNDDYVRIYFERYFAPEFINRLDGLLPFFPLAEASQNELILKELRLAADWVEKEKNIKIQFTPEVVNFFKLGQKDHRYGARPVRRAIEKLLLLPIAKLLLEKQIVPPDELFVHVHVLGEKLQFKIKAG